MEPTDGFVLDGSVTKSWCFDDEATPYTDSIRDSLAEMRAVAPSLWSLEVPNATIVGERRKRLDEARNQRFIVLLEALPIVIGDETSSRAFGDIRTWLEPISFPLTLPPILNWRSVVACPWHVSTAS